MDKSTKQVTLTKETQKCFQSTQFDFYLMGDLQGMCGLLL